MGEEDLMGWASKPSREISKAAHIKATVWLLLTASNSVHSDIGATISMERLERSHFVNIQSLWNFWDKEIITAKNLMATKKHTEQPSTFHRDKGCLKIISGIGYILTTVG